MPTFEVTDWGDAVFLSLSNALNAFLNAIPLVIGALLIIIIGWIIASALARLVREVLRRISVDRLFAEHSGRVYGDRTREIKPSVVTGELVKWLIRLVFLVAAANVLGLTQVSELLNDVLLWIPNLIVAAIILLVAPLLGRFVRGAIEVGAGEMGFSNAPLLGRIAEIAIVAFAVIIAINQIGIAANLVNTLFIGVVAAVALAFGLAFGLGGRDVAAQLTQRWYEQSQDAAARVRAHAEDSVSDTESTTTRSTTGRTAPGTAPAKPSP
jgi:hypothetical protein